MRQRAVIAIALCTTPDVVIADEPTTGLDVLVQAEIMALCHSLRQRLDLSIVFVTHNLPLIARHADRLMVMYQGRIVDEGTPAQLRAQPGHEHTRALFANLPALEGDKRWPARPEEAFAGVPPVVELRGVTKTSRGGLFGLGGARTGRSMSSRWRCGRGEARSRGRQRGRQPTIARLIMGMVARSWRRCGRGHGPAAPWGGARR